MSDIRSKGAIDLAVSLFKSIEEMDMGPINDILDQWKTESGKGNGININNYRLSAEL